jgi:lipid-binding SYLF domain-containing protein
MVRFKANVALAAGLLLLAPGIGLAQGSSGSANPPGDQTQTGGPDTSQQAREPREHVQEAANVVRQMKQDPKMSGLLQQARGVFVIPHYAVGALVAGISGGEGVMVARLDGPWSGPGFYHVGGFSLGAQAGYAAGSIAMVLLSDRAVERFRDPSKFSLTADAGLSLISWSAWTEGEARGADVAVWSDVEGLLVQASVGVSDVSWDEDANRAYYGESGVTPASLLGGTVKPASPTELQRALAEPPPAAQ